MIYYDKRNNSHQFEVELLFMPCREQGATPVSKERNPSIDKLNNRPETVASDVVWNGHRGEEID